MWFCCIICLFIRVKICIWICQLISVLAEVVGWMYIWGFVGMDSRNRLAASFRAAWWLHSVGGVMVKCDGADVRSPGAPVTRVPVSDVRAPGQPCITTPGPAPGPSNLHQGSPTNRSPPGSIPVSDLWLRLWSQLTWRCLHVITTPVLHPTTTTQQQAEAGSGWWGPLLVMLHDMCWVLDKWPGWVNSVSEHNRCC